MADRRVFTRGARRFEVVVISVTAARRRRARAIRRLAAARMLPSTIARKLGISIADVRAAMAAVDPFGGLFDAGR
ncbi:hypothetical protein KL86PLE_110066 [uncultured Pleomorphomonas sp.]|uniref:Uncharacterized protein n=1 Tax=uncultured Pleomorphomonas sp. TaxID=442121 RepID=A0A212L7F0_9HYPH|nr:hypothetical protein [uncultured Pleomorphomonas sp.]SCM73435.1 hypothetical protein KL86PLE_110066 [uncultured Pleomorphomonas sp.]